MTEIPEVDRDFNEHLISLVLYMMPGLGGITDEEINEERSIALEIVGTLETQIRADERRKMAEELEGKYREARQAHLQANVDHFAHDYCRWVGQAEAYKTAVELAERGGK